MWLMTEEESKAQVIAKLNNIIQSQGLPSVTIEELNHLTAEINWKDLTKELNDSSPDFLKLYLPLQVLEALKAYNDRPENGNALSEIIDKIKVESSNTITIVSTIN